MLNLGSLLVYSKLYSYLHFKFKVKLLSEKFRQKGLGWGMILFFLHSQTVLSIHSKLSATNWFSILIEILTKEETIYNILVFAKTLPYFIGHEH